MALFLIYADRDGNRNSSGINAVLVDAEDEAAARTAAAAAAPTGETKVPRTWATVRLADTATLPDGRTVIWIEGVAASLVGRTRGGDALPAQ